MENKEKKETKVNKDMVYTTKEMANALGITPKQLRSHLRKTEKYNDGCYTNYIWTYKEYVQILKQIKERLAKTK